MPKKGERATAAQKSAMAAGRKKRDEELAATRQIPDEEANDRWAKLLSGTLTVRDLDDEEILRMRVKVKGRFAGRARRLPSHLQSQFVQEAVRRAKAQISAATATVTKELLDIARDEDVPVSQRIKVLMYLQDRQLGKAPETVRIEGASAFDEVTMEALGLDREMADEHPND